VVVPPLRERTADVLPLAEMFAEQLGAPTLRVGPRARDALLAHTWPGNVRELANAVEHALALARGAVIEPEHLPDEVTGASPDVRPAADLRPLADVEREHILRVLDACGGNQGEAAKRLAIGRNTLWRKLRAYAG
jgi:two-component system response regulator HydG